MFASRFSVVCILDVLSDPKVEVVNLHCTLVPFLKLFREVRKVPVAGSFEQFSLHGFDGSHWEDSGRGGLG